MTSLAQRTLRLLLTLLCWLAAAFVATSTAEPTASGVPASTTVAYTYDVPSNTSQARFVSGRASDLVRASSSAIRARSPSDLSAPRALLVAADTAGADGAGDLATSCANSFTADTPVTLADGKQEPIKDVKVGDQVLATDPYTGQTKAEPVVALIRHSGEHAMVLVTLADGSVLDATGGHKIWDATQGTFVDAGQLRAGDKIETATGALITIAALTDYSAGLTAYNLQIDQIHTYYAGTTPVLVHNSCGMLGEDGTQVTSKTLTPGNRPYRIDVENPAPGVRPGQLHLQTRGGKYLYNFDTGEFEGIPGSLARQIANDPAVAQAIAKGKTYLGVN